MRRAATPQKNTKNTPLCSVPNCAKFAVVAGSDSKWRPCPVSFGVLAETAIVAEHAKKSPRNLFVASLNPRTLRVTPLHLIFMELIMALKIPSACFRSKLLGTVKTSNTEQTLCTNDAGRQKSQRHNPERPPKRSAPKPKHAKALAIESVIWAWRRRLG